MSQSTRKESEQTITEKEMERLQGKTADQQGYRDYHEGEFQEVDPTSGEERGELHMNARMDELTPDAIGPEPGESEDARQRRLAEAEERKQHARQSRKAKSAKRKKS